MTCTDAISTSIDRRSINHRRSPRIPAAQRRAAARVAAHSCRAHQLPRRSRERRRRPARRRWREPRVTTPGKREALTGIAVARLGHRCRRPAGSPAIAYQPTTHSPHGQKRDRAEIVRFMETAVMPWARRARADRARRPMSRGCATASIPTCRAGRCRRRRAAAVDRGAAGWENYGGLMDAQMRNAIYGYSAEPDKTSRRLYARS